MKLLICGHGRHGKDTVADLISKHKGYQATSSSFFAMQKMSDQILTELGYSSFEEAYSNRGTHRIYLYELIRDYNSPDKSRLSREILEHNQIYVGMRDFEEFEASKDLFDLKIWVDASDRLLNESAMSFDIPKDEFDIIIENNGSLESLIKKVTSLSKTLKGNYIK